MSIQHTERMQAITKTLNAIVELFDTLPDKQAQKDVAVTLAYKAGVKIQMPQPSRRTPSKPAIKRG